MKPFMKPPAQTLNPPRFESGRTVKPVGRRQHNDSAAWAFMWKLYKETGETNATELARRADAEPGLVPKLAGEATRIERLAKGFLRATRG